MGHCGRRVSPHQRTSIVSSNRSCPFDPPSFAPSEREENVMPPVGHLAHDFHSLQVQAHPLRVTQSCPRIGKAHSGRLWMFAPRFVLAQKLPRLGTFKTMEKEVHRRL